MATRAELVTRNKKILSSLNDKTSAAVAKALPDLRSLSQNEAGSVVRYIATGTIESYGNVATFASAAAYDDFRSIAKVAGKYAGSPMVFNARTRAEPIIGAAMSRIVKDEYDSATAILEQGLSRDVSDIYRETMVLNSERDLAATGYQRVASANACAFCLTVALNEYTTFPESGGYHNDCKCDTVPIYKGQSAYRPDYYDTFQQDYEEGRALAIENTSISTVQSSDIFSAIRENTGRN